MNAASAREDTQVLEKLNADYIRAVQDSDVETFQRLLSDDFLNSNPDGSLVDRAGFLAHIAKPATISGFEAQDVNIRLLGDLAVIHGRTVYTKADGQRGAGRYTDVWARRNGRWLCVAAHVTRG
jgi:ketosteroid isomerase-like protein